jgi:hypothetical protein
MQFGHSIIWLFVVAALQAFFKEAYKNRRRQQDGDASDERSGRAGRGGQKPDGWLENLCQVGSGQN